MSGGAISVGRPRRGARSPAIGHLAAYAARSIALPSLIFLSVAVIYSLPLLQNITGWGSVKMAGWLFDWDYHTFVNAVPRETLLHYHQFPLWNPYYVGGTVMLANPQSAFLSPMYVLVLVFGPVVGIKLEVVAHLFIGMSGMYILARYLKMDRISAYVPAFVFMLGSMLAVAISAGMTIFWTIAYLPFVFLFFLKSLHPPMSDGRGNGLRRLRHAMLAAVFLLLVFFEGGTIIYVYTALFLLVYVLVLLAASLFRPAGKHQAHYALRQLALILAFSLSLGAVKFVPTLMWVWEHPRLVWDTSGLTPAVLFHALLDREQRYAVARSFQQSMSWGWDENGAYVGWTSIILFVAGVAMAFRQYWALLAVGLVFLLLAFGNRYSMVSPWGVLKLLPVFASMRVATRFRMIFIFCLALFAGLGLTGIRSRLERRVGRHRLFAGAIPGGAVLLLAIDLISVGGPVFTQAFTTSQPADLEKYSGAEAGSDFRQVEGDAYKMYSTFLLNLGTLDGYEVAMEVHNYATASESEDYRGEAYLAGTPGTASVANFTPNSVSVDIAAGEAGYLVLNQNFSPGWRARGASGEVTPMEGLISAPVSSGESRITFYYLPAGFLIGLSITVAGLLFVALATFGPGALRRRLSLFAGLARLI